MHINQFQFYALFMISCITFRAKYTRANVSFGISKRSYVRHAFGEQIKTFNLFLSIQFTVVTSI